MVAVFSKLGYWVFLHASYKPRIRRLGSDDACGAASHVRRGASRIQIFLSEVQSKVLKSKTIVVIIISWERLGELFGD